MLSQNEFESLVSKYYGKARQWVRPFCRQYDRDDLAQLAVMNLMKRHERGEVVCEASFVDSLHKCCAAVSSRALRKERAAKRDCRRSAELGGGVALSLSGASRDPAELAEANDELDHVYNSADAVGKAVLLSMLQCDSNQSEAARWCGVSRAAAARRVAAFRQMAEV